MSAAGLRPDERSAITKILSDVQDQQRRKQEEEARKAEEAKRKLLEEQERRRKQLEEEAKKKENEHTWNVIIGLLSQPGVDQAQQAQLMQLLAGRLKHFLGVDLDSRLIIYTNNYIRKQNCRQAIFFVVYDNFFVV